MGSAIRSGKTASIYPSLCHPTCASMNAGADILLPTVQLCVRYSIRGMTFGLLFHCAATASPSFLPVPVLVERERDPVFGPPRGDSLRWFGTCLTW